MKHSFSSFVHRFDLLFLFGCSAILFVLWLPSLRYPLLADTAIYGVLGDTVLHQHAYSLFGVPHSKYLPFYSVLTIPFTSLLGFRLGVKTLSFLSGILILFLSHRFIEQISSRTIARLTVFFLLLQHALPIMAGFGASDLPFTALILLSLIVASSPHSSPARRFVTACAVLGFALLTRYNAAPLLAVFCVSFLNNTRGFWLQKKTIVPFFLGVFLAMLPLSLWLLRTRLLFGAFFPPDYVLEQTTRGGVTLSFLLRNALFYGHPLHTIGVFLPFAVVGILRYGRQHLFVLCSMVSLWFFATFWWSLGVRHVFPGFPLLLFFAALCMVDCVQFLRSQRWTLVILPFLVLPMMLIQGGMMCLYSFPQCNAAVDEWNLSFIPKDLSLTQEGMYAWSKAAEWMNDNLPKGELVFFQDSSEAFVMKHGYFRDDIFVYSLQDFFLSCQDYPHRFGFIITQRQQVDDSVVYTVPELVPATDVRKVVCR